jgi:glycosyltransferase involved in cell wall biosynthesis
MKRLLFIAPAVPRPTGSGVQMRGWMFLQGLARRHAVTLVVGSPSFPDARATDLQRLRSLVDEIVVLDFRRDPFVIARRLAARLGYRTGPCWDWAKPTPPMGRQLAGLHGRTFDRVHVFRLCMLPVALSALGHAAPPMHLDLDDWESETRLALSRLAAIREVRLARRYADEAAALATCERTWLPRVTRLFVASETDARTIACRHGLDTVFALENTVEVPPTLPPPSLASPADLLFVGALGYLPNRDAVAFLLDSVMPEFGGRAIRLTVAGAGAPKSLRRRLETSGCRWIVAPERIEPLYARTQIALAPIRAGGGTRIKALEAFARGRPLVATHAAMAGLDVQPNLHYLAAETPREWIAAIHALLAQAPLRDRITKAAFDWVGRYSLARGIDRVESLTDGKVLLQMP